MTSLSTLIVCMTVLLIVSVLAGRNFVLITRWFGFWVDDREPPRDQD